MEVFWKGLDEVMEWVYGVACQGVLGDVPAKSIGIFPGDKY
jgi:hypothetical protein